MRFPFLSKALFFLALLIIASVVYANNTVTGMIDGVYSRPDVYPRHEVKGWACAVGLPQSINVHIYAGGPAGVGHFVKQATANLYSDDAVMMACGNTGYHAYRFSIALDDVLAANFGQSLYIHGISPNGEPNYLISNSGAFTFPNSITVPNVLGYDLKIETGPTFGAAISSLIWKNKQFVNTYDHGREFQVAAQFNGLGECFNPTEAGSANNGGPQNMSTTRVISYDLYPPDEIITYSQPAFYLNYGNTNCPNTGTNGGSTDPVSNFDISKVIKVGYLDMPNVITVDTGMYIPYAVMQSNIESLVGSMDMAEFPAILGPDADYTQVRPISELSGGQTWTYVPPILASNGDINDANNHALGIYNPHLIQEHNPTLAVGHFRWNTDGGAPGYAINSWSCVFDFPATGGPWSYSFTNYLVVGNLKQVLDTMKTLHETPNLP